jgi:predicted ATP-grasp superfamily ATP-dependent carboligase
LTHDVLIVGASTRAAAFTAVRCGLRPRCVDYFADRDLAAVCPVERVEPGKTPLAFLTAAQSLPPSPWFYTGGFENHPDLVERIAHRHRLWGIGGEALRAVRNPVVVARVLNEAGIPSPDVCLDPSRIPRDGSWLAKPIASGGGRGIEPLTAQLIPGSSSVTFQRRVNGPSFSALFLGRAGAARLIGITRQWIGIPTLPFAYRGNIGPCPIPPDLGERLKAMGDRLADAFNLVGWFGVDYVLQDGIPWPVEINPRYPASLEIYELASGRSLMEEHRRACEGTTGPHADPVALGSDASRVVAKRVLYAPRRLVMPEGINLDRLGDFFAVPTIADVPRAETIVEPGEPVMTVFATGTDMAICRARLIQRERGWNQRLGLVPRQDRVDPF